MTTIIRKSASAYRNEACPLAKHSDPSHELQDRAMAVQRSVKSRHECGMKDKACSRRAKLSIKGEADPRRAQTDFLRCSIEEKTEKPSNDQSMISSLPFGSALFCLVIY